MKTTFGFIEFNSNASLHEAYFPDTYVSDFKGKIIGFDEEVNEVEVGIINGQKFDVSSVLADNFSMLDAIDSSMELEAMVLHIWDRKTKEFKISNTDADINNSVNTIIVIDEVIIDPKHRGNGIALSAIQATVRHWTSGFEWVAMLKAAPLQHCLRTAEHVIEQYELNNFNTNEKDATSKLISHYGNIGFECINDTTFMQVNGLNKSKFKV